MDNNSDLIEDKNTTRELTTSNYGDLKFSKERELNSGMSIINNANNGYQNKIASLGGND